MSDSMACQTKSPYWTGSTKDFVVCFLANVKNFFDREKSSSIPKKVWAFSVTASESYGCEDNCL